MDIKKNAKDVLDKVQNQWRSTGICRRTKDTDDNTETENSGWDVLHHNSLLKKVIERQMQEKSLAGQGDVIALVKA